MISLLRKPAHHHHTPDLWDRETSKTGVKTGKEGSGVMHSMALEAVLSKESD